MKAVLPLFAALFALPTAPAVGCQYPAKALLGDTRVVKEFDPGEAPDWDTARRVRDFERFLGLMTQKEASPALKKELQAWAKTELAGAPKTAHDRLRQGLRQVVLTELRRALTTSKKRLPEKKARWEKAEALLTPTHPLLKDALCLDPLLSKVTQKVPGTF